MEQKYTDQFHQVPLYLFLQKNRLGPHLPLLHRCLLLKKKNLKKNLKMMKKYTKQMKMWKIS
ncbi:ORF181 [White spot syndrome virus]|uniref:Wsv122 n=3 Tax=White spot syndrome virus TaxID=342409 RepID=Q8VB66_WSSVS|nr:wsv122 [Shrimp white spot syndrome virus]AFX59499.1 wsv122 [White spot syndrome virus]AAL33126.1 wsv122 [Shrimp white spot syndrome virus]AAL89046.1 WSSV178 [Shrimp white spot syndrome virus]ATU84185.1 ORF181 [White spot syndrome virus]AWQ60310.1 wsv122 [Shrimp white spot syndrome virus]